jgi:hypothetical protein
MGASSGNHAPQTVNQVDVRPFLHPSAFCVRLLPFPSSFHSGGSVAFLSFEPLEQGLNS